MGVFLWAKIGIRTREAIGISVCPVWHFGAAESALGLRHFAEQANGSEACDNKMDGLRGV